MQELFYEETCLLQDDKKQAKKYNFFNICSLISFILLGVWVVAILFFVDLSQFTDENTVFLVLMLVLPTLALIAMGVLFGVLKGRFYLEYDYTFISGSVRIAKIIKNTKRKLIYKFEASDVEKIGKYDSEFYNEYVNGGHKPIYLTSNRVAAENKDFNYMLVNTSHGKKLLVFECTKNWILSVVKYAGMTKLERGYK